MPVEGGNNVITLSCNDDRSGSFAEDIHTNLHIWCQSHHLETCQQDISCRYSTPYKRTFPCQSKVRSALHNRLPPLLQPQALTAVSEGTGRAADGSLFTASSGSSGTSVWRSFRMIFPTKSALKKTIRSITPTSIAVDLFPSLSIRASNGENKHGSRNLHGDPAIVLLQMMSAKLVD